MDNQSFIEIVQLFFSMKKKKMLVVFLLHSNKALYFYTPTNKL